MSGSSPSAPSRRLTPARRQGRRAAWWMVAAVGAAACASPGMPPGGPVDKTPPAIVKVTPDSGAKNVKARSITIAFNEVVSERARGGDLANLVVLSPSDGSARVNWHRDAITVRPHDRLRPNTAYSVTLMPGISDLSGNATTRARTFVFSTGASIPQGVLRGAVFDWTSLKPANGALVEARVGSDTTFRWIARADTTGRYEIPLLPAGPYLVRALIDGNANGRLDAREPWDSLTVSVSDSARLDLYGFAHDTLGPRVLGADVKDSVTLRLSFDRPLALSPALLASQITVRAADSTVVPVRLVARAAAYDSLARRREAAAKDSAMRADTSAAGRAAVARTDSLRLMAERDSIERARVEARRAARDTMPKLVPPVPTREAITADFVAVLGAPLAPGSYRVLVQDAVSASGVKRSSERTFTKAKPAEKKSDADEKGDAPPAAPAKPPASATPPKPRDA